MDEAREEQTSLNRCTSDLTLVYPTHEPHSSNVSIHIAVLSLHIILLNQPINIPLDIAHRQHTSTHRRFDRLAHQLLMAYTLPGLEDADHSGLTLEVPVLCHANMSLFVLFFGLFELDLIDLDAVFGVREVGVDAEAVGCVDVFALGSLG